MPVHPVHFATVGRNDFFCCKMELLAVRTFEIRIFDERYRCIGIAEDMILRFGNATDLLEPFVPRGRLGLSLTLDKFYDSFFEERFHERLILQLCGNLLPDFAGEQVFINRNPVRSVPNHKTQKNQRSGNRDRRENNSDSG
jgi:hypothetical protein